MNINEAIKLATPGPLGVHAGRLTCTDDDGSNLRELPACHETAALLAHWYNHGPELLKTLKRFQNMISAYGFPRDGVDVAKLIAEASEVEGL